MTLEEKYQLSLYEKVTRLSDDKQIWLVKNIETNEIYVRKELLLYNFEVYAQLKEKQFDNIPKVIECVEEENRLIVIRRIYSWKDTGDCNGRAWGIIGGKCGVCYPIAL